MSCKHTCYLTCVILLLLQQNVFLNYFASFFHRPSFLSQQPTTVFDASYLRSCAVLNRSFPRLLRKVITKRLLKKRLIKSFSVNIVRMRRHSTCSPVKVLKFYSEFEIKDEMSNKQSHENFTEIWGNICSDKKNYWLCAVYVRVSSNYY